MARDRFDVTIRGRVICRAPVESVRLEHAGKVVSATSFGHAEVGAPAVAADGLPARQQTFQFNFARPLSELPATYRLTIVARGYGGEEAVDGLVLGLAPNASVPITLIAAPLPLDANPDRNPPHGMLQLEAACIDSDGILVAGGWAVGFEPIEAMEIGVVFDGQIAPVAHADLRRQRHDVAGAFPIYPDSLESGFALVTQLEPKYEAATVLHGRLLCRNGFAIDAIIPVERVGAWTDTPLGAALAQERRVAATPDEGPAPEPEGVFKMFCDAAELSHDGTLVVNGWAVCDGGIVQIRVMLNDDTVGLAALGHERSDVGAAYKDIPSAFLSGFRLETQLPGRFEGDYRVRVIARNTRGEERMQDVSVAVIAPDEPKADPDPGTSPEVEAEFKFELDCTGYGERRGRAAGHRAADDRRLAAVADRRCQLCRLSGRSAPGRRTLRTGAPRCRRGVPRLAQFGAQRLRVPLPAAQPARRPAHRPAGDHCEQRRAIRADRSGSPS